MKNNVASIPNIGGYWTSRVKFVYISSTRSRDILSINLLGEVYSAGKGPTHGNGR